MASDWSELDEHLLAEIAQRIRLYRDFLPFHCVCTAWRSSANIDNFRSLGHNSLFAIEVLDDDSQCKANCIFYTDDCVEGIHELRS